MPDIDLPTVIFALVALFVAYKLRSVLGMRSDAERPTGRAPRAVAARAWSRRLRSPPWTRRRPGRSPVAAAADRWKGVADPDAWSGLDAIAAADKSFASEGFLSGARAAYDMIVHAFAAGDSATLRGLMAPEAFANFDNAIRARAAAGHTMSTTVVSIDDATIAGGATRRNERANHRPLREQARLGHPRRRRNRGRRARRPKSPTISISGRSSATCARATPTGG